MIARANATKIVSQLKALFSSMCVAVDGSPAANAALGIALDVVDACGEIMLVNVLEPGLHEQCVLEELQQFVLVEAKARCVRHGIAARVFALRGNPEATINAFVRDVDVDAIAMGSHTRRGAAAVVIGSTAHAVSRAAHIPVIVTAEREYSRIRSGINTIVIGIDESDASARAAKLAHEFAIAYDADRIFVNEDIAMSEDPATRIAVTARERCADLIVIGTNGNHDHQLTNVAARIVPQANAPILIVPPPRRPEPRGTDTIAPATAAASATAGCTPPPPQLRHPSQNSPAPDNTPAVPANSQTQRTKTR